MYLIRNVNIGWKVSQLPGFIKTRNGKVLEIREEEDGVIPVKPGTEDVPASSKQKWNVITVEIDSKSYHMFSIGDFVLTGEWTEETSTEQKKRSLIVRGT